MTAPKRKARCGTTSGYSRHQRLAEKPCASCTAAKSEYDKRWREASGRQRRDRTSSRAQARALSALKWRHQDEYRELYRKALAEARAEVADIDAAPDQAVAS